MRRTCWTLSSLIVAGAMIASAILYPRLPDRMPVHWNIRGEIDGYGSKTWGTFFFPCVLIGLLALFAVLPRLTPRSMSMEGFRDTYAFLILLSLGLLAFIHALALLAATGHAVDFPRTMMLAMFVFFALTGNVLGKVTRNPYDGIKVPWTLTSDRAWNATHRLGAWLFTAGGIAGVILIAARAPMGIALAPLILAVIVPIVYSYLLSRRLKARGEI